MGEGKKNMLLGIDASQANRDIRSGTEWYAFYLIQEFKRLLRGRNDVRIRLYARNHLRPDLVADLPENFEIRILRWPFKYFWVQKRLSLEMLLHPPDILFCPAHTIPLIHPKKTFTTLHDIGFEDYPELYDKLSLWYHKFSARLGVKKAYHIFTVSQFSKSRIMEVYDCPSEKITVTYLGYDAEKFKTRERPEVEPRLAKYGLSYKNYLFFVGRMEPKKNILNIVKAYERLLSLRAERSNPKADEIASSSLDKLEDPRNDAPILALAGRKVNVRDVEAYLAGKPELSAKIKFIGHFEEGDLAFLYAGAIILVFPTLYEGFGLPIIEAQACGTPVVTSNTSSCAEVAGQGAIIVDPEIPEEISEAIRQLLSDPKLREEKISAGFENIKRFSWQQCARTTFDLLLRT
ncbi:MAG: glycosyltransferase family 1 protein [Candidatus Doudnabacteria bacterium]|nr:glycosyltransferase family 1 protein [Candidatus Doudnabacteria bacterium]